MISKGIEGIFPYIIKARFSLKKYILHNYFLLVYTFYFLYVFYPSYSRPGVIASFFLLYLIYSIFPLKLDFLGSLVLIYFIMTVISIFVTYSNGFPVSVGLSEFSNSSLPIVFFFVGQKKDFDRDRFYVNYLYAAFLCFLIGMYWYVTLPPYYIAYLQRTMGSFSLQGYLLNRRFASYLSSVLIGMISSICVLLSGHYYIKRSKLKYLIMLYLSFVISILSMQRASYLMSGVALIMLLSTRERKKTKRYLAIIVPLIFSTVILLRTIDISYLQIIFTRFQEFGDAIGERSGQWRVLGRIGFAIFLGRGLGSMSHKALGFSDMLINDGGFFKLIGELGLVGFALFVSIVIGTVVRFLISKERQRYFIEPRILLLFFIQSLGSNSFFFQALAPLFWLSIGILSTSGISRSKVSNC